MKKIIILSLFISSSSVTFAQPAFLVQGHKKTTAHARFVQAMLARNPQSATLQKTTVTKERLITETESDNASTRSIVTTFSYNSQNSKGSSFNNVTGYTVGLTYGAYGFGGYEDVNGAYIQGACNVFADTVRDISNDGSTSTLEGQQNITYNGNTVTNVASLSSGSIYYTAVNYDGQNNPVYLAEYSVTNSVADTQAKRIFVYAQNRLVSDTGYANTNLAISSFNTYTYDGQGNLTQVNIYDYNISATVPMTRYVNTFTSSNQLSTSEEEDFISNQWQPNFIDSFGYTSGVPFYTFEKATSFWNGTTQMNAIQYHVSATGLADSAYAVLDTGLTTNQTPVKCMIAYDSYNNPITTKYYYGNGTTWAPAPYYTVAYTYETYNATAVPGIAATASNIKVYPNPAQDVVSVSGLDASAGVVISLVNTLGQVVVTQNGTGKTIEQIDMNRLTAGIYMLIVTDNTGTRLHSQQVVKQ